MDQYGTSSDSYAAGYVVGVVLFYLVIFVLVTYAACRVAKKAGYSPWLGLLYLVPIANLVLLIMFVFSKWPIEREVEQLRANAWAAYGGQGGYPQAGFPQAGASGAHPSFGTSGSHPSFGAQPTYGTPTYDTPGAYGLPGQGYVTPTDGGGTPGWPPADPGQQPRPGGYPPA
jgi:hypothetical protein